MSSHGHSSNVSIRLHVDDAVVRVAQVGGESLILGEPFECPPESEGEVVIVVDGHRTKYHILIDNGITNGERTVQFTDVQRPQRNPSMPLFTDIDDLPF